MLTKFLIYMFNKQSLLSFLALSVFAYLAITFPASAEDINTVFSDINTKTTSIMDWVTTYLIYLICLIAFIATLLGMLFRKISYVEGITVLIITILVGFAPTIVSYLVHQN